MLAIILALQQQATELFDQLAAIAAQAEADFATVFAILGGESGSIISQHEDNISLIVAALDGDNNQGQFTWIQQTADAITLISQDLARIDGDLTVARSDLTLVTDRVTDAETGVTALDSQMTAVQTALVEIGDDLAGAQSTINSLSALVYDPVNGLASAHSRIDLTTGVVNGLTANMNAAQTSINQMSAFLYDPTTGLTKHGPSSPPIFRRSKRSMMILRPRT